MGFGLINAADDFVAENEHEVSGDKALNHRRVRGLSAPRALTVHGGAVNGRDFHRKSNTHDALLLHRHRKADVAFAAGFGFTRTLIFINVFV